MSLISGKFGFVLGALAPASPTFSYSLDKWDLDGSPSGMPDLGNWNTQGAGFAVPGVNKVRLTASGPWDVGNTPLQHLGVYNFQLGLVLGVYVFGTFCITLKLGNDFNGFPTVAISGMNQGPMTLNAV